jgi:hypothetical protein
MTVFFATPCYRSDPKLAEQWAVAVAQKLRLEGSRLSVLTNTYLSTAQAQIVKKFLDTDCSHLFFRDDDIFVEAEVLQRMLDAKVPAIVAPYLVREANPPRVDVIFDGTVKVLWAGLGCALVERRVIEALWKHYYDELHYLQDKEIIVGIFRDFFAQRDDGVQLVKSDHAFWFRVRECGFTVEALSDVMVNHAGLVSHFKKEC